MKYVFFVFCLLSSLTFYAQTNPLTSFADKYEDLEDSSNIRIGDWMIKMAADEADEEEQTILNKISGLQLFSVPNDQQVDMNDVLALKQTMQANNYEALMQIRDDGDLIDIYLRENGEVITDLFILIEGEELTLINLSGNLTYDDLKDIDLDIDGLDSLDNLPSDRNRP